MLFFGRFLFLLCVVFFGWTSGRLFRPPQYNPGLRPFFILFLRLPSTRLRGCLKKVWFFTFYCGCDPSAIIWAHNILNVTVVRARGTLQSQFPDDDDTRSGLYVILRIPQINCLSNAVLAVLLCYWALVTTDFCCIRVRDHSKITFTFFQFFNPLSPRLHFYFIRLI